MHKIIIQDPRYVHPFNERARDLRIQNKPLWLSQRDVLAQFTTRETVINYGDVIPEFQEPCLVHRDNLFFDKEYVEAFLKEAKNRNKACRAAFSEKDSAFIEHALPLSNSYTQAEGLYLADFWYFPNGPVEDAEPLVIDLHAREVGYYHIPGYMAFDQGDLVFQVPLRSLIAIDTWVHIFIADVVFGLFSRGARFEDRLDHDLLYKISIMSKAFYEGRQVLECSELVKVGKNCVIDPHAVIHGPTTIGDNVTINAGTVIENCIIGNNVNISQGCHLMLSVVGDGSFLPFRASLFMTTMMDNSMVAQNTCLQMCVVGRNSFIGASTTFTDYNLLPTPIRALNGHGKLTEANRPVLGGCVGHNCRLGSGLVVFPARTIESDVLLFAKREERVIYHDVSYENSDHHQLPKGILHTRSYPRADETMNDTW
jgi:acetyltransferase-like isoleucine patch superfamily enzyme